MTIASPVRLSPVERLEALCDPGSLELFRSEAVSLRMDRFARPNDGVVAGAGRVAGRPVFCYAQDPSYAGGSLGEAHADTIVRTLRLAERSHAPVVSFVESAGARLQEGLAALAGYGRVFAANVALSGKVPQISVINGTSAGGGSYSPALTDFVVMTRSASMFLTGPGVVREVCGEDVDADELGGPRVHERNGVCQFVVEDDHAAALMARSLLDFLPQSFHETPSVGVPEEPLPGDPGDFVPANPRQVYDVRDVITRLVDGGRMLEVSNRWARNMVCAFSRLDGRAIGVVANQPRHLGGVIDADAATKAAKFVRTCNAYGLPLVVLVDTPGYMPGTTQERAGVIRHGAKLVFAFAEATVPRVTVGLRKSFGGAHIAMNSRDLGADFVFAWPTAKLGVMGAPQAVSVLHRRHL
ncbi:MAG: methylmalonyl-CoA carboxyltransferase, partial [Solirubrobacterales bacterium]|nr:methylmalonyl-CoA carboxyltransferase [Solirubrobacterales bacterium]